MKTLADYIRGYGSVPILLIAEYKYQGIRYSLLKEDGHDSFYFCKGNEVIYVKRFPRDQFPRLAIDHINNRKDTSIIDKIEGCASYKAYVSFIKEQTGEDFTFRKTS